MNINHILDKQKIDKNADDLSTFNNEIHEINNDINDIKIDVNNIRYDISQNTNAIKTTDEQI
jgi:predicted  nucleic acid-binding Zn-ribbon protein